MECLHLINHLANIICIFVNKYANMAAPVGNQFWKFAMNAGKPRAFESPDQLWQLATEYFEWCDANPLQSYEWNGKDPVKCELTHMRAYTWTGLALYCGIASLRDYKNKYEEYSQIIARIDNVLYTQKFEGASAGLLNPNIIARDLGLAEKREIDNNVSVDNEILNNLADKINANSAK